MEPLSSTVDPYWEQIVTWGVRIGLGIIVLLVLTAMFKGNRDQKRLNRELARRADMEED